MKKLFLTTAFLCCAMTIVATPVTPQLSGKPTAKGVYIHQGKKVVMK